MEDNDETMPRQAPQDTSKNTWPDARFKVGALLIGDDFSLPSITPPPHWIAERENGGEVAVRDGRLVVDVPAGCTVWFDRELTGPLMIEYDVTAIRKGGPNDRVSDLNCFWMAQDPRRPGRLLEPPLRSGKFADYDDLTLYYVGLGGNSNTTTRFRRYVGKPGDRPLLPENDKREPEFLIRPNVPNRIRLVACRNLIQYYRDDRRLFELRDPAPFTHGWFGLRTTANHMEVSRFRVYALQPIPNNGQE